MPATDNALALVLAEVAGLREATFTTSDGACRPNDESVATWSVRVAQVCHAFDVYTASQKVKWPC